MPTEVTETRQIAALVAMPRLLAELGFAVNERTRRAPCLLHSGSNPTAFAWREDGRWHCFSCGEGGDRIALVRAARRCSFREAVEFLSGVSRSAVSLASIIAARDRTDAPTTGTGRTCRLANLR